MSVRIRTIKPEYWQSRTISKLSMPARLLFVGLWNLADDRGVGLLEPAWIRSELFRFDADLTDREVLEWIYELVREGLIESYEGPKLTDRGLTEASRSYPLFHVRIVDRAPEDLSAVGAAIRLAAEGSRRIAARSLHEGSRSYPRRLHERSRRPHVRRGRGRGRWRWRGRWRRKWRCSGGRRRRRSGSAAGASAEVGRRA